MNESSRPEVLPDRGYLIPEEPEYRIYASSQDGVPVIRDICGDERLRLALAVVREWFPEDTIFVREVIEIVREAAGPINTTG